MRRIVILHTNDLHGQLTSWKGWDGALQGKTIGGLGRLAGAVAQVRQENAGQVLLLDAGDLLGDTMIADLTEGRALIQALNHLRYDALAVGNHEPDFGLEVLRQRSAEAKFQLLAANLVNEDGTLFTKPYVITSTGGVAVGILGLAYPNTGLTTAKENVAQVRFEPPIPVVKRFLSKMRSEGAEVIVVLSHLGLTGDQNLAQGVEGIDVIVGGHSHNRMTDAERAGNTLIVQAGAHGSDLGRLDLKIENGKVIAYSRELTVLDHETVPSDPAAETLVEDLLSPHRPTLDDVIGHAEEWLARAQTLAGQQARKRDEESLVDSLFADILRAHTGADIVFLPGVGYGVAIPPGPVTAAQLRQLVPHRGRVVTMQLSGAQVLEVLEQAVDNVYSDDTSVKVGGMVQVSGIQFRYDPARPRGQRVWQVQRHDGDWDANARFDIATNSMLAEGGHNYRTFLSGENRVERGSQYAVIRDWIRSHSPVQTPPPGRIRRAAQGEP